MRKKNILFLIAVFIAFAAKAQETQPEMADTMRSNGKIYVVVLVLATIFVGLIAYLVRLDRKIGKIEKIEKLKQS